MKFGFLYEHQLPRPWADGAEVKLFDEALEQIELADRLGYDYVWEVEHHFLEEYAHSSAPEVFLAAASQRTRDIRLGHGVVLAPPAYNHPARVAERIATLDILSHGRVDWGTGESGSRTEMEGFGIDPDLKKPMWAEGVEQAANMMAMEPYPGYEGEYFSMPCRNVVPKPVQRPHPPIWVACSRRETIHAAARAGIGALTFAFVDPEEAGKWAGEYYDIIKSEDCVPIGHTVNANIAMVTGFSCHEDEEEAFRRGADGLSFFAYAIGHYYIYGHHMPGVTDLWQQFQDARAGMPFTRRGSGLGTPEQVRAHLQKFVDAGVDQAIFIQQGGNNRHEHICEAMELFADKVMPEFHAEAAAREARKQEELAPHLEAAMARKRFMPAATEATIPVIPPYGKGIAETSYEDAGETTHHAAADVPVPLSDPRAKAGAGSGD
jgi:alkanesulfonate monooxygenase SsuD/methylene tetrahydromethanopterin reductase-like flavin-dependent oxidoreductase (luciferase family)